MALRADVLFRALMTGPTGRVVLLPSRSIDLSDIRGDLALG